MNRLVQLLLLSAVALGLSYFPLPLAAQTSCTQQTTCASNRTLKCCGTTSCSASPGVSVTCGANTYTCSAIDAQFAAYNECRADCLDAYNVCRSHCTTRTCLADCGDERFACQQACGPAPATTFGC